jgi:hypothetical protein
LFHLAISVDWLLHLAFVDVRRLLCLISSGSTASVLNNNRNGVKLAALQIVVLAPYCLGMTSDCLPFFLPSIIFLIAPEIKALARSTAPFDCGWYIDAKEACIPTW